MRDNRIAELSESLILFKQIASSIKSPPTPDEQNLFWLSQLRTLQILDRAQKKTQQIIPKINQLRLIDDELGGDGFTEAFDRLEDQYRSRP